MSEITSLSAIHKSVTHGPAWHGPAVLETLRGLTPQQAAARPIPNAHTIWEILLHIIAWQEVGIHALHGKEIASLPPELDWPPAPQPPQASQAAQTAWDATLATFTANTDTIRELLAPRTDDFLRQTVPGRDFPYKILLHGIAHHNLYHAGQIALLRKAQTP